MSDDYPLIVNYQILKQRLDKSIEEWERVHAWIIERDDYNTPLSDMADDFDKTLRGLDCLGKPAAQELP